MAERKEISFWHMLGTDWWCSICAIGLIASWVPLILGSGLTLLHLTLGNPQQQAAAPSILTWVAISVPLFVLCAAMLARRYYWISDVLARGEKVVGKVTAITFWSDRGQVVYSYAFRGTDYSALQGLRRASPATEWNIGTELMLVVNPDQPDDAYIEAIYIPSDTPYPKPVHNPTHRVIHK